MRFDVDEKVFEVLPNYCLGVLAAKGIDNSRANERIETMLDDAAKAFQERYKDQNIREIPNIKAYRDAFAALFMNPNKFMCSIEALAKRVQKHGALPHIDPIVDLGNAISIKYSLSLGAHDIAKLSNGLSVRFSETEDRFLPMGGTETEDMPEGELIYVSGHTVKTRRFIWRQSDDGKIGEDSSYIFFPIDGFSDVSREDVLKARDEIAAILKEEYACEIKTGYIDKDCREFGLDI